MKTLKVDMKLSKEDLVLIFDNAMMPQGIDYWGVLVKEHPASNQMRVSDLLDAPDDEDNYNLEAEEAADLILAGFSIVVLEVDGDNVTNSHDLKADDLAYGFGQYLHVSMRQDRNKNYESLDMTFTEGQPQIGDYIIQEAIFAEQKYG